MTSPDAPSFLSGMFKPREQMEQDEAVLLAPYAKRVAASAGRRHPEAKHPYRTDYQRDRARVIHSRAFRRLEYKTQVFLNGTGDHFRTRLTHTIEVASVSRTIARALGLNEDLAEAIALAHDLGHPPFGHPGEDTLNRLMKGHGGFDHNAQSLRVVEVVETNYPDFVGLNLTYEVTEGLRKHQKFFDPPSAGGERFPCPSLEAQIANLADEITYNSHDLDDGLDADLIDGDQLAGLALWHSVRDEVKTRCPGLGGRELCASIIRRLIDRQVEDVVRTSAARIDAASVRSPDDARRQPRPLIAYSDELRGASQEMRRFLFQNLYYHPKVVEPYRRACARLEEVFGAYLCNPERLGHATAARVEADGLHRTVCDYLSGMTDRYLLEEHTRLFGS